MAFDSDRVGTVTFDSFGTLVDVDSTAAAVEGYVDEPVAVAREWHSRAASYGVVANQLDAYESYYELHRLALAYLLAAEGVSVSAEEIEEMTAIYHEMEPFGDVREGMERLHDAGYTLGVVTNGDPPMLESMVEAVGIGDFLSATVSAHEIERHKPARELYEHAADRLDAEPATVAHVSNGYADVQGAVHAGMQGVWLDRQGRPPDPFGPDPHLAVDSMAELLEHL